MATAGCQPRGDDAPCPETTPDTQGDLVYPMCAAPLSMYTNSLSCKCVMWLFCVCKLVPLSVQISSSLYKYASWLP